MAGSMNLSLEQTGQPHLRTEQTLARNSAVEVDGGPENGLDLLRAYRRSLLRRHEVK